MTKPVEKITWKELLPGCVVDEPGNASEYLTGDWRSALPVIDYEACIRCGVCWLFCPEASMNRKEDRYPEVNLDYCKGCGICATECPAEAISMGEED